jgi:hypothetical protein
MRCESLLCSLYMSRCILLPCSLLLVLIQLVCENMRGVMCIIWSNLVVVMSYDNNFMTCYGVCQFCSYLTRDKKECICYIFSVTVETPKLTFMDLVPPQYVQVVANLLFTIVSKYLRLYSVNS